MADAAPSPPQQRRRRSAAAAGALAAFFAPSVAALLAGPALAVRVVTSSLEGGGIAAGSNRPRPARTATAVEYQQPQTSTPTKRRRKTRTRGGASKKLSQMGMPEVSTPYQLLQPPPRSPPRFVPGLAVTPNNLWRTSPETVRAPSYVASAAGEEPLVLWQGGEQPPRPLEKEHAGRIVDVKFFPAGDRLLTVGVDGKVIVWSAWSGSPAHQLSGGHAPGTGIVEAQVFPDGLRVITLGLDKSAVIWHAISCAVLRRLNMSDVGQHRHLRVFPKGDRVLSGVSYGAKDPAVIWSASTGGEMVHLTQMEDMIRFIELSECGRKVVTAGYAFAHIWDAVQGTELLRLPGGWISGVAISAARKKVLLGDNNGAITIWDMVTGSLDRVIDTHNSQGGHPAAGTTPFALLSNGRRLATFSASEAVVWDLQRPGQSMRLEGTFDGVVGRVATSPRSDVVAVCSGSDLWGGAQHTTVWDGISGHRLRTFTGKQDKPGSQLNLRDGVPACAIAVGPAVSMSGG